jgi:hypothetical protein
MDRYLPIIIFLVCLSINATAQTFTDSNLPIIIVNTDGGKPVPDEPGILSDMKIIYRGAGQRTYLSDQNNPQFINYSGRIDIELRGSSTQVLPKKQYGFSTLEDDDITEKNVELLGLPEENDWILGAMSFDPLRIRDYLCYNLSRMMGEYASRTVYCELVLNGTHKGLFLLLEKVKADDDRINVIKIDKSDKYLPDLTGGYITKSDKVTGGDKVAWTMQSFTNVNVNFIHQLPKPENVTYEQNQYIKGQFEKLSAEAYKGNAVIESGYPSVIDVLSFVNYMLIQEFASNSDAYQFSTFYHKDRNGKLRAGPIWDNDLTYGNDIFMWGLDRSKTNLWQFLNGDNEGPTYFRYLYRSNEFRCRMAKRWSELTGTGAPLNLNSVMTYIDQTVNYIDEAVTRDRALWGVTGTYSSDLAKMKEWIQQRIKWISENITAGTTCPDPVLPPVAITKIMYHPKPSVEFPDPSDLEFIEIRNTGDKTVSLSGAYFTGTGFIYQFPAYTLLKPGAIHIIANNAYAFKMTYGFAPSGEFTRNLSDSGEELVLADGFGNIIDYVEYSDTIPWPGADGNGYYLELVDDNKDNNDPSNWIAAWNSVTSGEKILTGDEPVIAPNPASGIVRITSVTGISEVQLYNLQGMVVKTFKQGRTNDCTLDVSAMESGIYIVKIITESKVSVRKLIKQ